MFSNKLLRDFSVQWNTSMNRPSDRMILLIPYDKMFLRIRIFYVVLKFKIKKGINFIRILISHFIL